MRYPARLTSRMMILGSTLLPTMLVGQTTDQTADKTVDIDQDVYLLSPFEVTADSTEGYSTTETLAGTRLRTDLRNLANSISVVNTQFLKDTGVTSSQDLLVYTTNTEVGGVYGNFAGTGGGTGYNENAKLLRPNQNTRVRGLDAADNTQNYFLTEVPWDTYNVDRVELQRGPNSILFGVGSPAGIVNSSTKQANFKNAGTVEARVGSYGSIRGSVDVNRTIIDNTLAVRVIGLYKNTQFQQDPAYERDSRIYGAVRWEPKLFGPSSSTSIRANFEHGDIKANRPRSLPPIDAITPWFKSGESYGYPNLNKRTFDPNVDYNRYGTNKVDYPGSLNGIYPWFHEAFLGRLMGSNPASYYNANSATPMLVQQAMPGTGFGRSETGEIDKGIGGIEFGRPYGISTYSNYAAATFAGGSYYSDYSLSDTSTFNFYKKLMDGDNKKEWQKWISGNASLSQTFFQNRVGFEVAAFYQNYEDGQYGFLQGGQFQLSVDINSKLLDGSPNPNVGRPYVGNSGQYGSGKNFIDRDCVRGTGFVDLRSTDFFQESLLTRILGHTLLSGLVSQDIRKTDNRTFQRWAYGTDYADALNQSSDLTKGFRTYDWIAYIGPSLMGSQYTSAKGLHLSNVSAKFAPASTQSVRYFNSNWNATGVNYGDPYTYIQHNADGTTSVIDSSQSENPANYVGWSTSNFRLLSAENGDIDSLYSSVTKAKNTITSAGATLQSFLLDDNLVVTYGWRKDRVKTLNGQPGKNADGVADAHYKLKENDGISKSNYADGISRTWGIVVKSPDFINRVLPIGMQFSGFYGEGENFKADAPRGDVFGNQIANPKGDTKDYGFVVSVLDNRISLKTTWYETSVANATLNADSAGFGSANLYYVWAIPLWGSAHALSALDYLADSYRDGGWYPEQNIFKNPDDTENKEALYAAVQDWFKNMPVDQHFSDEYGLGMNIEKMHAAASATYNPALSQADMVASWSGYYSALPAFTGMSGSGVALPNLYNGSLKSFGAGPSAAADTTSKGIEWELNGRITDNWNVTINVSKTKATISSVSPTIGTWIDSYSKFLQGPAGQLSLWGGQPFQQAWANNVVRPYQTLLAKIGSSASEVAPWSANIVTNYNFSEGMLKGLNVGAGYRWIDDRILGYQYDAEKDALDIKKPWKDGSEDHFDLWVGYTHALSDDVSWRIQLNVRNVGESTHLVPVYIQPDGTTGYSRIAEGTSWFLTNTFEF